MKKIISMFLCLIMVCALFIPAVSFAAGDKGLENAIKVAKTEFKIPESYSFNFDVYTQDSKKVWSLTWTGKGANGENITIRIDEEGKILSYDNYKAYEVSKKRLPKISKLDAKGKAQAFVKKINPDIYLQLKLIDNMQNSSLDYGYSFGFIRMVKNIPYYANGINVVVNRDTGEVQSYSNNWSDDLKFPEAANSITIEAAQKAFKDKLGLELIYKYSYQNDKLVIYPVYTTKFNNESFAINALTGEKVQTGYVYSLFNRGFGGAEYSMKAMDQAAVVLTPEEIKAVDDMSALMTQLEAEKLTRSMNFLKLSDDFKLESANLSRSWPLRTEFQWQLNFTKVVNADTREMQYLNVNINAKTGEVINFYKSTAAYGDKDIAKYDEAAAKVATEAFLKEIQPDKFKETEFDNTNNNIRIDVGSKAPLQFNFGYTRKVNGAKFPDNSMSVGYDAVTGEVTNYNMTWFNTDFPAISKVMSLDSIYNKMFSKIGLELQYKLKYTDEIISKMGILPQNQKQEVIPVYALKNDKPLFFDATSGEILDYEGKVYKEVLPVNYTDISGHYAEKQITLLGEYGISLDGTKFNPNDKILQKDFLLLLSKTLSNYYGPVLSATGSAADIENLYNTMIREGVIKESEKAANSVVKREDAVKFIIRALKYDKVAEIKGIFKTSFNDVKSSELNGFIAIAQGLHIINGYKGNFRPKDGLARADAMIILYNYLQI